MSKFMLLNFEDFGLNQDITKTIQSHTLFCICCRSRNVPQINLLTCTHADFLNSFGIPELNPAYQVVCYQCHDMLKKIKLFKLQVGKSLELLVSEQNNPESSDQKLNNLVVQHGIDINIAPTNYSDIEIDSETIDKKTDSDSIFQFEVPVINTVDIGQSSTSNSIKEKKKKNIEEALRIIESNKNNDVTNDCFNLLATSLKTLASTNLGNLTESLLKQKSSSNTQKIEPNTDCTESSTEDVKNDSEIKKTNIASEEIVEKKEEDTLPVIIKVESVKSENINIEPTMVTDDQLINERQNMARINLKTVKLTKEELMQERLNTAASQTYLSSPHRCEWCLLGFHYKENLDDHFKRKHAAKLGSITCEVCLQVLYPPGSYNAHTFRHYNRLECSVCGKRYELHHEVEAIEHYKREHIKPIFYKCQQCPYNTRLKDKFKTHVKKHKRFSCKVCGARFDKLQKLKLHAEATQHAVAISMADRMKRIKRVFRCTICKEVFKEATTLQVHRLVTHPDTTDSNPRDLHICQQCGKKYKNWANLKQHLASHLMTVNTTTDNGDQES